MSEINKEYIDERIDQKISHSVGVFMEHFDDKFAILVEGQQFIVERIERFERESREHFLRIENRIISLEIK